MEQLDISLPGGGVVQALRLQDLPAEQILAFMTMAPEVKPLMSVRLLKLALGAVQEKALDGMTYGELEHVLNTWVAMSGESTTADEDGRGMGLDWSEFSL